jgi:toxin-antitoxin system PIN domain toxin
VILPDVSVLLYCLSRRQHAPRRGPAVVDDLVNGDEAYGMSPQVLAAVVRLSTHRRVFASPSRLDDALKFARVLMQQPHCTTIASGPRHWEIFEDLCRRAAASGNLVQDAWYAALAIEAGCEWVTTDGDFARFPGLRWRRPF